MPTPEERGKMREEWNSIESDQRKEMDYEEITDWWLSVLERELGKRDKEIEKIHDTASSLIDIIRNINSYEPDGEIDTLCDQAYGLYANFIATPSPEQP